MFCHQCGGKILEGASFCNSCGSKVNQAQESANQIQESVNQEPPTESNPEQPSEVIKDIQPQYTNTQPTPQNVQNTYQPEQPPKKQSTLKLLLPILIPILSFVIVVAVLAFTFTSEQKKNDTVLELQKSGENSALEGNYAAAVTTLNEAINLRPDYEVLTLNLEEINKVKEFSAQLDSVSKSIASQDFEGAEQLLTTLKEQVSTNNGPLFTKFQESITQEEERIAIGKVVREVASLTTIDELAANLSILETMSSPDVESVRTEILEKIVQISNTEATEFLANGQFAEAMNAVNKGLSYKADDEQLLQLKEKIEQEKVAVEEQAAEEDLHNRTAAVELVSLTANLEENGDVTFEGTIKSNATVPIYTILIYYALYDNNGELLFEGNVSVEPDLLEPGDEGYFSGLVPEVNQEVTVEVFNATWYFDQ
ncbi:FxLYD domain-containing protein [Paucisalibacillus globulus]|uniref:FxLYD domain-containing protein n=1 Tax=Paucisalibacillus globulus TaxID=351095 RepID=UPI0003F6680A|nr:FxLYD domain-containing protein [Paucisalibacillus globulus]